MQAPHTHAQWSQWLDTLASQDFVCIDNFFSDAFLLQLTAFFQEKEVAFKPAKIGQARIEKRMPEIRSDLTYWLDRDRDTDLNPFFSLLEDLMERLKQELFLSLQGFEFHFALYPAGGFYKPHIDQFDTRSNRMISMIVYLNAHWKEGDGGELRIHQESNFIDIAPIMNRAVLFRSDCVLHEVLPSVTPRRSLTGWLLKRPSGVGVFGL
jgi:SM-20-related protein